MQFKKNTFIVLFIIIFDTLSFSIEARCFGCVAEIKCYFVRDFVTKLHDVISI